MIDSYKEVKGRLGEVQSLQVERFLWNVNCQAFISLLAGKGEQERPMMVVTWRTKNRNTLFVVGADVGSVGKPEVIGEKVMGSFKVPAPQCQSSPDPEICGLKKGIINHYDHLIKGLNFRPYFLEFEWLFGGWRVGLLD